MARSRESVIEEALREALWASGRFKFVVRAESLNAVLARIVHDTMPAAVIVFDEAKEEPDSSEPGDLGSSSTWSVRLSLHLLLHDEDGDAARDQVEERVALAHDLIDGKSLGGLSVPAWTRISGIKRNKAMPTYAWRELIVYAPYLIGSSEGHDALPADIAELLPDPNYSTSGSGFGDPGNVAGFGIGGFGY